MQLKYYHSSIQRERVTSYFKEIATNKYMPRAILTDLEPVNRQSQMFDKRNSIGGLSAGTGSNWAKGHFSEGASMTEDVLEVVRREAESCELL